MGKRSRDTGKRGEQGARAALCSVFDIQCDIKRFPRSSGVQSAGGAAPDLLGFYWHVEVKSGEQAKRGYPGTKLARDWRDKAMVEAAAQNEGKPAVVMRKAHRGAWFVASWQAIDIFTESLAMWVELPLEQWAQVEMRKPSVCDWLDGAKLAL